MIKRLRVIAGPNGSGKSTLYQQLCNNNIPMYDFLNADDMKREFEQGKKLSLPFSIERKELDLHLSESLFDEHVKETLIKAVTYSGNTIAMNQKKIDSYSVAALADFLRFCYLSRGLSFSFETVFSHPSKLDFLKKAYNQGYRIYLYFVATEDINLNINRVKQRKQQGGHDVPEDKIKTRYSRCLNHFFPAIRYAYRAYIWDNSTTKMKLLAEMEPDHSLVISENVMPKWFNTYILQKITATEE